MTAFAPAFVDTPMTEFVKGQVAAEAMIRPGGHRGGGEVPAAHLAELPGPRDRLPAAGGHHGYARTGSSCSGPALVRRGSPDAGRPCAGRRGRRPTRRPGGGGRTRRPRSTRARPRPRSRAQMTMPRPRAVRRISRAAGRLDRVAAHGLELGADQPRSVGPAELLAEEAELGGAVAVAGGGVLGVGEAATAALLEAEAELDVLGAGHVRVEVADALEDVAAVGGVRGDRVGGIRGEGEALPVAEQAGRLALGGGGRRERAGGRRRRCRSRGPRRDGRAR